MTADYKMGNMVRLREIDEAQFKRLKSGEYFESQKSLKSVEDIKMQTFKVGRSFQ